jgi:hypothetical protein
MLIGAKTVGRSLIDITPQFSNHPISARIDSEKRLDGTFTTERYPEDGGAPKQWSILTSLRKKREEKPMSFMLGDEI